AAQEAKRPLRHGDYDGWKTIQSPVLSRDGKYLAYNLLPADGDGEFVVRNLASNAEHRVPRGRVSVAAVTPGTDEEDDADQPGPRRRSRRRRSRRRCRPPSSPSWTWRPARSRRASNTSPASASSATGPAR